MSRLVDSAITYRILHLLVTPFDQTQAYRFGIIDDKGNILKKEKELKSQEERDAFTLLHRLVFRIKRIIERVPIENKKLLSFSAALALIKEQCKLEKEPFNLESLFLEQLKTPNDTSEVEDYLLEGKIKSFLRFIEDAPANSAAASPGVAGFTPDTVGVRKKKAPPLVLKRKLLGEAPEPSKDVLGYGIISRKVY